MVFGNMYGEAASSQQEDLPVVYAASVCNDAQEVAPDVTHRFLNDGKSTSLHIRKEIQPGSDIAWSVIERGNLYAKANYPSW